LFDGKWPISLGRSAGLIDAHLSKIGALFLDGARAQHHAVMSDIMEALGTVLLLGCADWYASGGYCDENEAVRDAAPQRTGRHPI
jgi:hypothetical protein